jgi:hypothetical protein
LKKVMKTWEGFRRLDAADRRLAIGTTVAFAATRMGLRFAGLRRCRSVLLRLAPRKTWNASEEAKIAVAQKIARIQDGVSRRLIWHASCLEQSLVLWWQLRRSGIAAEMRIGVRKQAGRFEAHAWVELGNVILNDFGEAHVHFAPFDGSILSQETSHS